MNNLSSSKVKFHICTVDNVYDSGMIDATSEKGSRFKYINTIITGSENFYKENDRCLVIEDRAQIFALGKINYPTEDDEGNVSIRSSKNDLIDLKDTNTTSASDNLGNESKQIIHPTAGIISDAGDGMVEHLDPSKVCKRSYRQRAETVSVPHYKKEWHDGETCNSFYKWRSKVDVDSFDKELIGEPQSNVEDKGASIEVNISDDNNFVDVCAKKDGNEISKVTISQNGDIVVDSKEGSVVVKNNNSSMKIKESGGTTLGKNNTVEVGSIIDKSISGLSSAFVITSNGPKSLIVTAPSSTTSSLVSSLQS